MANSNFNNHKSPSFLEAFRFWLKLGFISFGGPSGQIAIMHQELVEKKKWISDDRFFHALNYCMLLPGPEAQQLAIYIGWLLHRTRGGIAAGVLFVLPSAFMLWGLSWLYVVGQNTKWVTAIFHGLKAAVLALVLVAVLRIGSRALKNRVMWGVATLAFIAISILKLPYPLIIVSAALVGLIGSYIFPEIFLIKNNHGSAKKVTEGVLIVADYQSEHTQPSFVRALTVIFICSLLWWLPVLLLAAGLGWNSTHVQEGLFFSSAAMVTFGGAYAVLPFVAQQAVEKYGWLSATQMMDGLGLAETTPGPLIMVLQFVGFIGAWNNPPLGWSPIASATLGAAITTWVTFVPCFLWIFLGAPYIERIRGNERLSCALSAVTAAVVGIVANLLLWFAWHTICPDGLNLAIPWLAQFDCFVVVLAALAFFAMRKLKLGVFSIVLISIGVGLVWNLAV